jgi:outer membrane protein assembly factor BamB
MRRQFLTLFLTLLLLISIGGAVSVVGATSHVTPGKVSKPIVKEAGHTTGNWVDSSGIVTSPANPNGVIYVGSSDHNVYALNAMNGTKIWNYTTGGIVTSPAVANGIVYVGSWDYNVYALNAMNGTKIWNYTTGGIVTSPAVANGVVYTGSDDSNVYALNAMNGTKIWNYTTGGIVTSSRSPMV